jgi:hypothetical protein
MTKFLDTVVHIGVYLGIISMMSTGFEAETEEIACHIRYE